MFSATLCRKNRRMSVKAFPQIQQSPSGYALPGAKRFLTESLGFQFYEHSVKLPKLQETRRTKSRYGCCASVFISAGPNFEYPIAFGSASHNRPDASASEIRSKPRRSTCRQPGDAKYRTQFCVLTLSVGERHDHARAKFGSLSELHLTLFPCFNRDRTVGHTIIT
jgi:hypothetical protein